MLRSVEEMLWKGRAKELLSELAQRFPTASSPRLAFEATGQRGQKAYAYFHGEEDCGIVIDLGQHASREDVENSVYHEFRHLMQHRMLDEAYMLRCRRLKRDRAWYLFSPTEIDARVFARTRGDIADLRVFEDIGKMEDFDTAKLYLYHCMAISRKYGVG